MVILRRLGLAAAALVAFTAMSGPASAYWGGYRGYGYGYRGYGYGGFGPGLAYGGFYPRPYYATPYYLPPPAYYASPPVFVAPPVYAAPRPRPIVHRIRPVRVAPQCRCLQPMPTNVPAPLRDIPSPGP